MSLVDSAKILLWVPTLCGEKTPLQKFTDLQWGQLGDSPAEAAAVLVSNE